MTPLNESGRAVKLAVFSAVEVAFLREMNVDRGIDGNKFLQVSHAAEAQQRPKIAVSRSLCYVGCRAVYRLLRNSNVALRSQRLVK